MNLTVEIPDELAGRLNAAGGDLSRRALEALALEEYKSGHLTEDELRRLLGFGTRYRLDGFLKAHGVLIDDYTIEDLRSEVETLQRLEF
jgi:predicted HTH domain antitoxin